jgi:predicted CoA-substrate-specific enzyme activase
METKCYLGLDCGSVSLNIVVLGDDLSEPICIYRRTRGRPLETLIDATAELRAICGRELMVTSALVTGSGRDLLSRALDIPAINEISAHSAGIQRVDTRVRTIIEIGGQDSKFICIEPASGNSRPRFPVFRMNEICAAGTGAFLDEQAGRLGMPIEDFGQVALRSTNPAAIAGRCAVFAKTDMIHKAQEGVPLPDILMGLSFALARNYIATLIRGDAIVPVVSLQGGVMSNEAVVHAFRTLLALKEEQVTRPPYFTVLGAMGCATLASESQHPAPLSLSVLEERAKAALLVPPVRSSLAPLGPACNTPVPSLQVNAEAHQVAPPLVMGLDIGSVSVKGVIVDRKGCIFREDYRLSMSRPLETLQQVVAALTEGGFAPEAVAVTGSGRYLAGRLIEADTIVNEITAQARAALSHDPNVDTVIEIGGQDSKWICIENGRVKDFEMNRVCAAGTGSFLMEQADRLGIPMGEEFSDRAFASRAPSDLGNRCTVFMESDLIHHQNNRASAADLAAGVCVSVVHNYLERVANHKAIGERVLFLGGVAATPAVKAAFERETGRLFHSPDFFKVSGALGAALKAFDGIEAEKITPKKRLSLRFDPAAIKKKQFRCNRCSNQCLVDKYFPGNRVVHHGGLCDRWEAEQEIGAGQSTPDPFAIRTQLLEECGSRESGHPKRWGMVRSPQFYEWFPFWKGFCDVLGIELALPAVSNRKQFEAGLRFLKVETCLPVKVMAGHLTDLVDAGITTVFHPSVLTEAAETAGMQFTRHCPYIQATSQFFRGSFDVEWQEPLISYERDPDSFQKEHERFARSRGLSRRAAAEAFRRGTEQLREFRSVLLQEGTRFLAGLAEDEPALVVLGKPYHTSDPFLNMNLGSLFRRVGIQAVPGDLYPLDMGGEAPDVTWKYQGTMIRVAREIAADPRLFPVMITFFGCGPDPFTLRHIKQALGGKPLLVLEMDEHSSRAGVITRLEAFLEQVRSYRDSAKGSIGRHAASRESQTETKHEPELESPVCVPQDQFRQTPTHRLHSDNHRAEVLFLPYMADHSFGFAAAARSVGIDARVLPPPDLESEHLGRPLMVGGECHPYALILGDYLKLAQSVPTETAKRSLFYVLGPDACRLGQYSAYIEKVRQERGHSIGVISEIDEGLASFGISGTNRRRVLLRGWEGLNAFDLLMRLYIQMRPFVVDRGHLDATYARSREKLYQALSVGRVRRGMEEGLHELHQVSREDGAPRPIVAVTGDYYTRVVPFANNEVYREIERLGGVLWTPPTFSDAFKLEALRDAFWSLLSGRAKQAAADGLLALYMAVSEFRVKGGRRGRKVVDAPLDLFGFRMWKTAAAYANSHLPPGITAPLVTALDDVQRGADGILNLITLNCSYGTVVTAALMRELKRMPGVPLLTLVFDGLKKTNENTRLEAFMEQVHDRFRRRTA